MPGATRDQVFDFVSGTDVIDLQPIDADTAVAGNQEFAFSASGPAAHSVRVLDKGAHMLLQADVNGDRTPAFEI